MGNAVTVNSDSSTGEHFEITLEKTGPDKGHIRAKSWRKGHDHKKGEPDTDEFVELYDIRSDGVLKIACMGDVPGPDPTITCTLRDAQQPAGPVIKVEVRGTFGGFGDRTAEYSLERVEFDKVRQFIATAAFPPIGAQ